MKKPFNKDYSDQKNHHRIDGFVNRYSDRIEKSKSSLFLWQWERFWKNLPKPPQKPIEGVIPDIDFLKLNHQKTSVTWIGHSTLLLQIDGVNILTDPHWGKRASPFSFVGPKRHQSPGVPFEDLPPIHAVLISHNHFDHLDAYSIKRLMKAHRKTIRFYVPLGVQYWMKNNVPGTYLSGILQNVFPMDWNESIKLKGNTAYLEFLFLPVKHWSARSLWDQYATLWGSWAVLHPNFRFWFSGDLGFSKDTEDIGKKLGSIDLAAISIGAYEPRWFMKESHINPEEAVQVMRDVRAKTALGIHWGTFEGLTDESLDQPPIDLALVLQKQANHNLNFFVLKHGQTKTF